MHVITRLTEQLAKDWTSGIYAFFEPHPAIEIINLHGVDRYCHEFKCNAPHCLGKGPRPRIVRCFLDTEDKKLTSNLRKHAKKCWADEWVNKAVDMAKPRDGPDLEQLRAAVLSGKKLWDGSITAAFARKGSGKETYSTRQLSYTETR
jgi:hypothetical protein